jgi:hypothetical protein
MSKIDSSTKAERLAATAVSLPLSMTKPKSSKPAPKRAGASAGTRVAPSTTKETRAKPVRKDGAAKKDARSEDLRVKVTAGLKQRFKQAAKAAGVKKGVLLERLLAAWEERSPAVATASAQPAAEAAPASGASPVAPGARAKRS